VLWYLPWLLPSRSTPPKTGNPKSGGARDWSRGLREAAPLLGLGMTLAATVLAGVGAGYWLDARLGTRPWLLLLGACLGVAAALVYFIQTVTGSAKGQSDRKP
jgi:F0F1-type ATP synthase assembly protein I